MVTILGWHVSTIKEIFRVRDVRQPKFTPGTIVLGATAGLVMALFMDVGGPSLSRLERCLGFGTGAMIGVIIAAYSDLDLFRPASDPHRRDRIA
jgi:hypothetical protein